MDDMSRPKWERLGDLLAARRGRIDPRYAVRKVFTEDVGVKPGVLRDIETAARDNYTLPILAAVEGAYRWAPGSIQRVLAGEDPIELPLSQSPREPRRVSKVPPMQLDRHGGDTVTLTDEVIVTKVPRWFATVLERHGQDLGQVLTTVDVLRKISGEFDSTLGELLHEAGLATPEELTVRDAFEAAIERILSDYPDLPRGVKKDLADSARQLREAMTRPTQQKDRPPD